MKLRNLALHIEIVGLTLRRVIVNIMRRHSVMKNNLVNMQKNY